MICRFSRFVGVYAKLNVAIGNDIYEYYIA